MSPELDAAYSRRYPYDSGQPFEGVCKTNSCNNAVTDWEALYCEECHLEHSIRKAITILELAKGSSHERLTKTLIVRLFPTAYLASDLDYEAFTKTNHQLKEAA